MPAGRRWSRACASHHTATICACGVHAVGPTHAQVWDKALECRLDRGTTFVALGGGVVGDMTGFAASCYQRGVHFVQASPRLTALHVGRLVTGIATACTPPAYRTAHGTRLLPSGTCCLAITPCQLHPTRPHPKTIPGPRTQVPTTVMSQVDSSVGGKTGVNHPLGKNMIGAFYQPLVVLVDTNTLATLPDRELASGFSEVIKYGLIRCGAQAQAPAEAIWVVRCCLATLCRGTIGPPPAAAAAAALLRSRLRSFHSSARAPPFSRSSSSSNQRPGPLHCMPAVAGGVLLAASTHMCVSAYVTCVCVPSLFALPFRDAPFFEWLEANMDRLLARDPEAIAYAVERSCINKVGGGRLAGGRWG